MGVALGAEVIRMKGKGACSGIEAEAEVPHADTRHARRMVRVN